MAMTAPHMEKTAAASGSYIRASNRATTWIAMAARESSSARGGTWKAAARPYAPHLVDVEVIQGLQRLVRTGEVPPGRAEEALADLTVLDLHRHPHLDLAGRAWKLRDNISAYDALYVALGEAMAAPVVTCDGPLARAPGHRASIEFIA